MQLADLTDKRQVAGLWANLYTARSPSNWGVGDLTDLGRLAERAAAAGADFIGVNPLHALHNRGWDISPYSPASRLFRDPLYVDIARLPEAEHSAAARALLASSEVRAAIDAARRADAVAYAEIAAVKRRVLRACFDAVEGR